MKLAIMQPYFFPYLGYFGLIRNTDSWIVFDTPQFIYHGWIARNRILDSKEGWQYINAPLRKHSRNTAIRDIQIRSEEKWKDKIFAKLTTYKKIAPYYTNISNLIHDIFEFDNDSIVKMNCHIIKNICSYLQIEWNYSIFSEMNIDIEKPSSPDEWALNICKNIGYVNEYWNLPGGKSFFDRKKYSDNNINLKFYNQILKPYYQKRNHFEAGLSIIDVLMFNSVIEINLMFKNYEII